MFLAEVDLIFADVLAITLSVVGFLLSLQGLWLVSRALWPRRVEAATRHCENGSLRCFLLGLPVTFAAIAVAVVIAKLGTFGQLAGFALMLVFVVYSNIGAAGFVTHIGRRLASPADAERPWKATVRGGVALQLAWLIPILGWVGLLPITVVIGAGAATFALFSAGKRAAQAAPAAAQTFAGQSNAGQMTGGQAMVVPLPAPAPIPPSQAAASPYPPAVPPVPAPIPAPALIPAPVPISAPAPYPVPAGVAVPPLPRSSRSQPPAGAAVALNAAAIELEPAAPVGVE